MSSGFCVACYLRAAMAPTLAIGLALASATGVASAQDAPTAEPPTGEGSDPSTTAAPSSNDAGPSSTDPSPAESPLLNEPASSDASVSAAEDEAAALALAMAESSDAGDATDVDQTLNFYGFADFTLWMSLSDAQVGYPWTTFSIGNLNLYAGSELGDDWRWLSEVRFMYLPHGGATSLTSLETIDTTVIDYTDFGRTVRWGGISIERAYIEKTLHPLLTVRLGHFLTPYGIWNVDHGSPVIIPVTRPFIVGENLFPRTQTGIELYGTWNIDATQLGYHLTLSNGRGPVDAYQDFDHNKALGGRLFLRQDTSRGTLTLGASGYKGQYTELHAAFGVDDSGAFSTTYPIDAKRNEVSLAVDLKWEWQDLLVQAEAILNDATYVDGGRPASPNAALGGPPGFAADYRNRGYYGLLAYQTPFFGIMPYVFYEHYWQRAAATESKAWRGGLNIRPTPRVSIKAELVHATIVRGLGLDGTSLDVGIFQTAWSF
jgi:hypothetical protein